MRKKNDNIHTFIVEEEYRRCKAKQNSHYDVLGKAQPQIINKENQKSVFEELEKMHSDFGVIQECESLQTSEGTKQIDLMPVAEPSSSISDLDLLASLQMASLQKMKAEEQELIEQKQRLVATEKEFHSRLVNEIEKKKNALKILNNEIIDLRNKCNELSRAFEELSM